MWDLEYLILFGLPNNKLELLDGITPLTFPFPNRRSAEQHFDLWIEQLARWRGASSPIHRTQLKDCLEANIAGAKLQLYLRPIRLALPMQHQAWDWLSHAFWRRDLWEGQPPGLQTGWENSQRHWEVKHKLWDSIRRASDPKSVTHCGGVDVMLTDTTAVAPDHCFYNKPHGNWMIGGDFYAGPPDLVAEVLSPPTRTIDRGIRMELYSRAGVPHLWLLDPEIRTVELYQLTNRTYDLAATYSPGQAFKCDLFDDFEFSVSELFESQWERHPAKADEDREPMPAWFMPPDVRVGLEYMLLFGHPERRYEIWDNTAPCMLAFGSEEESELRFQHFLEDICRWEAVAVPTPTTVEPGTQAATVGRFRLFRKRRHVRLHVTVDAARFRELLVTSASREGWNWGEKD